MDFTENIPNHPLEILRQICGGQRKDFGLPTEVCGIYGLLVSKNLNSDYLAKMVGILEKYNEGVKRRLKAIILAREHIYSGLDANLSKGALELVAFDTCNGRMASLFDLSVPNPEHPYLARLVTNLENIKKKVCHKATYSK